MRDAQGNVMAVNEKQNEGTTVTPTLAHSGQSGLQSVKVPFRFGAGFADLTTLRWTEQHLYGSSRLGIWKYGQEVPAAAPNANPGQPLEDSLTYGDRYYELSNHLGNVLASISDKKKGFDEGSNNTTDYFLADIAGAQDYYPFGMSMPGRKYSSSSSNYRYGFNGKENDSEVKGEGNQQDYGMRIYDPRLGKFLSVDPISQKYPELTPYQFASNRLIEGVDMDGMEFLSYNNSYIRISVQFDSKLNTLNSETTFRIGENQINTIFNKSILPGKLEDKIMSTPSNCNNCIPNYESRVTSFELNIEIDKPEMTDLLEMPTLIKSQEFRMLKLVRNKEESVKQENSRQFNQGISGSLTKWDARIAFIELAGKSLEKLGEDYLKRIVSDAKGYQTFRAIDAMNLVKEGIEKGFIGKNYQNNKSLSGIANYLLYGAPISDKTLEGVAKRLWNNYKVDKIKQELIKESNESRKQKVDNTGRNNGSGY